MDHVTHTLQGHAGGHVLHLALVLLATVIFAVHVGIHAYRHGFPTFSWRIAVRDGTHTAPKGPSVTSDS